MKMMPPDVISHENQLQRLSEPSIFMLDILYPDSWPRRTDFHTTPALAHGWLSKRKYV